MKNAGWTSREKVPIGFLGFLEIQLVFLFGLLKFGTKMMSAVRL